MRSKKTIRKLHPLTRALAKLQREVHSLERRMDKVIQLADEIEQEGRTNLRENARLRGVLAVRDLPEAAALWPEGAEGEARSTLLGLTESEVEEGRQAPAGCDPVAPGEGAHGQ